VSGCRWRVGVATCQFFGLGPKCHVHRPKKLSVGQEWPPKKALHHNYAHMQSQGVHSMLYFAYTCVQDLFIGGGLFTLRKRL
jgi:hypothetical protein